MLYARWHPSAEEALKRLRTFGEIGSTAQLACRFRLVAARGMKSAEARQVEQQIQDTLEHSAGLTGFAQVQLAETLSPCWEKEGRSEERLVAWEGVNLGSLALGPRIGFLSGHGRDSIISILKRPQGGGILLTGCREALQALALEQSSDLRQPDVTLAFGGVIATMTQVRSAVEVLDRSARAEILQLVRARSAAWNWSAPLEDTPEVFPDEKPAVRRGRQDYNLLVAAT